MSKKDGMDLVKLKTDLSAKYNNVNVHDIVDNNDGSVSMVVSGEQGSLDRALAAMKRGSFNSLPVLDKDDVRDLKRLRTERAASIIRRDSLGADYLDLTVKPSLSKAKPHDLYKRAMEYYKTEDVYGSSIDILTNFASKGFKNDIDDPDIRNFYDNWVVDTGFDKVVEQIFFEFFRSGFVRTYKVVGKYLPKVNYVSPIPGASVTKVNEDVASRFMKQHKERQEKASQEEKSAKKIKWSKDYIPIRYTVLNPTLVEIEKSSLMLDQQLVLLKAEALKGVKDLLETPPKDLTDHQKLVLKSLPTELKKAAADGEDLPLDPYLVGAVDYRRQPYELYPYPRGVRAFESMEYKKALRDADYSTLDGITNFILVITIGNDDYPIKDQTQLEAVAELFDTPSKAFNVVWDHTLKVQRIEPGDVGDILGQDKYRQVNDDITGAFGVIRALIDGVGSPSKSAADLAVKAILEEIHYARKEVSRWIYAEYRDVAEAMAFERYPKVRFDNMILRDEILMMNVIQGMLDRRIISYRTGHELLGFDFETLLAEMGYERDLVLDGTLGILGSPYQLGIAPGGSNVQDKQRTPTGTPSEGRPKGQPAKKPDQTTTVSKPKPAKEELEAAVGPVLQDLSVNDLNTLVHYIRGELLHKLAKEDGEE